MVYRNDGNGTFSDVSRESGIGALRGNGLGVVIADYDDDSWPDIFVANDSVPNVLFHRTGVWRYEDVALRAGWRWRSMAARGMGVDAADYDGDGHWIVVTNLDFPVHLFRGLGGRLLRMRLPKAASERPPFLRRVRRRVLRLRQRHASGRCCERTHAGQPGTVPCRRFCITAQAVPERGSRRFSDVTAAPALLRAGKSGPRAGCGRDRQRRRSGFARHE